MSEAIKLQGTTGWDSSREDERRFTDFELGPERLSFSFRHDLCEYRGVLHKRAGGLFSGRFDARGAYGRR